MDFSRSQRPINQQTELQSTPTALGLRSGAGGGEGDKWTGWRAGRHHDAMQGVQHSLRRACTKKRYRGVCMNHPTPAHSFTTQASDITPGRVKERNRALAGWSPQLAQSANGQRGRALASGRTEQCRAGSVGGVAAQGYPQRRRNVAPPAKATTGEPEVRSGEQPDGRNRRGATHLVVSGHLGSSWAILGHFGRFWAILVVWGHFYGLAVGGGWLVW
jgi:hypothetical protein